MNEIKLLTIWIVILSAILILIIIYLCFYPTFNINIEAGNYTLDVGENFLKIYNMTQGEV